MVLVSLLGDFHSSILPIFFEFKDKLDKHILVYDESRYDKEKFARILNGQKSYLDQKNSFELIPMKIDEDNYESILQAYVKITSSTKNRKELYLNTTDGLSSVAIVLSNKLLANGAKVLSYDKYSNMYYIYKSDGMDRFQITNNLDIKNHLKLIGYKVLDFTEKRELDKRKDVILELTSDLADYKSFVDLLQNSSIHSVSGYGKYKSLLESIDKLNDRFFIQGTVFEEYIYHLINDKCDTDDVMTGVKVEFNTDFMNELDILMIKNNHLHTIECKLVNSLDGEHYVYKTDSVMDYLDDDGKAMILSVGADNVRLTKSKHKKVQFTKGTLSRARNGDIKVYQSKIFNEKKFLRDVQEWFSI